MIRMVAALYIDPRAHTRRWPTSTAGTRRETRGCTTARIRSWRTRDDADCGPRAVEQVRRWGGVLEQPSRSKIWERCGLPDPGLLVDGHGGFSVEVEQVAWGHVARKTTWLYVVGAPRAAVLAGVRIGGTPTHWVSGWRNRPVEGASGGIMPRTVKVCSAQQRRRTPPAFAEWLVSIARSVPENRP